MSTVNDIYGHIEINRDVSWGANTQRSLNNFPIGIEKMPHELIDGLIILKKACAIVNKKNNRLESNIADAIITTCNQLLKEKNYDHFPLSIWQTGSGTQTNMNVNEVIANRADNSTIHPNDHVNCGQSSNDVFPTAMHIATLLMIKEKLMPVLAQLEKTMDGLINQYGEIIKTGRTHLQDATPIAFGQELSAYKQMCVEGLNQLEDGLKYLRKLAIGATAVGTGLNTTENFDHEVTQELNKLLKESFVVSENKFHAMSSKDGFVFVHGVLNSIASNMMKMAHDIRLLASGPRCGLGEINLPANEAGSSIMPGKVNPTQCEALSMVCVQVLANNQAITMGSSQGHFQLNAYMPLIMYNTWQSIRLLSDALDSFDKRCLSGITVNKDKMDENLHKSLMTATYLNRQFGYDETAKIVKQAHQEEKSIKDVVLEHQLMTKEAFDEFFDYEKMIRPSKK